MSPSEQSNRKRSLKFHSSFNQVVFAHLCAGEHRSSLNQIHPKWRMRFLWCKDDLNSHQPYAIGLLSRNNQNVIYWQSDAGMERKKQTHLAFNKVRVQQLRRREVTSPNN